MQNSVSLGLFTDNATITKDAMDRALAAMTVRTNSEIPKQRENTV